MIGKTVGHHEVTHKLGEGGMGALYKDLDLHPDRFIALKILLPKWQIAPAWLLKEIRSGQ